MHGTNASTYRNLLDAFLVAGRLARLGRRDAIDVRQLAVFREVRADVGAAERRVVVPAPVKIVDAGRTGDIVCRGGAREG